MSSSSSSSSSSASALSSTAPVVAEAEKKFSILSLGKFAELYPLYEMDKVLTYRIYYDIVVRNEYIDVNVVDGAEFGINSYIFTAKAFGKNVHRSLVPCNADGELDMDWLRSFSICCAEKNEEFYLCIANYDTVIYQLVTHELP